MAEHHSMKVLSLRNVETFFEPEHLEEPTTDSPAMEVVTDFHHTRPLILESDVTLDEAARLMTKAHVNMKLVVDHKEHFLGIVSKKMLLGSTALQTANQLGVERSDLTVANVMVPRDKLHALSYEELQRKTIGDVLNALQELGEQHILVLDESQNRICGVISANDIAKMLHAPVEIVQIAANFNDVVRSLSHQSR